MYTTEDEFAEMLDNNCPQHIQEMVAEYVNGHKNSEAEGEFSFIDACNFIEQTRVNTIKELISMTHNWSKANAVEEDGFRTEIFWCNKCNMKASMYEHIHTFNNISKVIDRLPTYTVHNQYLMLPCMEVQVLLKNSDNTSCKVCGIAQEARTEKCRFPGH